MDFTLSDEQKIIQQTVRRFVERELMPLENEMLQSEGKYSTGIEPTVFHSLRMKAKEMGFWGINTPEEYGGANLGPVMTALIAMELGRTLVPFSFGGGADNILYLGNEQQKKEYLIPTIEGSATPVSHSPSRVPALTLLPYHDDRGERRQSLGHQREKVFITGGNEADFAMVFAVTDRKKPPPEGGVTCFLVDREMGWTSGLYPHDGWTGRPPNCFSRMCACRKIYSGRGRKGFDLGMQWIGQGRWLLLPAASVRQSACCKWRSTMPSSV